MRTETIRIEMLFKGGGRPIEWPKVESLMESMTQLGLLHPIIVRRAVRPGVRPVVGPGFTHFDAYEIIAGNHRYEAAKLLKWETVPCTVVEMDDLHARRAERCGTNQRDPAVQGDLREVAPGDETRRGRPGGDARRPKRRHFG
jgi:hypothetical protein